MGVEDRLVGGRYRLLERLGSGGMGTVWRADDVVLGRQVAVKEVVFPPGTREEEAEVLRERTRREARSAARLDHPSAVTVYDVVEEDGRPWLVLELVEARTLAQAVTEDGPLPPDEVARVGLAVLGALEAAHAQGIVHRDVKPSNVLLRADGRVVLTDFGIATTTGDSSLTHTGLLLGSPAYIAPERIRGESPGPASDLWSLGATLFTAVEGRPPFDSGDALLTVTAVVTGDHAPYVQAGPLAPALDALLEKDPGARIQLPAARAMLQEVVQEVAARGPESRTQTLPAAGLAAAGLAGAAAAGAPAARTSAIDLDEVRQGIASAPAGTDDAPAETRTRTAAPPPPAPREPAGRPGWLVPAGALAAVLLLGGAGYALTQGDDASTPSAAAGTSPTPVTPAPTSAAPATTAPPASTPSSAPTSATTSAPATTTPADDEDDDSGSGGAEVPEGWTTASGAAGWTAAVPPGWTERGDGEFRDSATGRSVRVATGPGQPDAVADRREQARSFASRYPSYEEISISEVDYRGYEAADWEFTYEGRHVLNRVFVVDGTGHSLFFQTSESDFPAARADFEAIADAFQPVGE